MKALQLVLFTGLCFLSFNLLKAQVKIGDDRLNIATDRWLEIKRVGQAEYFIVTDSLFMGMSNFGSAGADETQALRLKLFGYGLDQAHMGLQSAGEQATVGADDRNIFLAPTINGRMAEVPLGLSLVIQDSTVADLGVTNGLDTFGIANLMQLDSIFATDNQLRDSTNLLRTLINNANTADEDTMTGNEYIDQINVLGDTALEFVENENAVLGATNRDTVDLSPILGANTFYLADGEFDEDRTVTGDGHSLAFNGVDSFTITSTDDMTLQSDSMITINGDQIDIQQDGQSIIMVNAAEDVKFRSTGVDSILYLDSTGRITMAAYGDTSIIGTLSTILAVDADGNVIEITAQDILSQDLDSTIYNSDGTLTGDRRLDGSTNDLSFVNVGSRVDSSVTSLSTSTGDNVIESTGANGEVDLNASVVTVNDSLRLEGYGDTSRVGTYTTILGSDIDGNVVEVRVDQILSEQVDSTIYNNDGVLLGDRRLDGSTNDLSFVNVGSRVDSSVTSLSTSTGDNVVESTGANGEVDLNASVVTVNDSLRLEGYGDTSRVGTYTTILGSDIDGNVVEVRVDQILAEQIDSTIYNNDGVLLGDRRLDGSTNDLSFVNVGSRVDSSVTSLSTSTGDNVVESTGANGEVDLNASVVTVNDSLRLEGYGDTSRVGTYTTILGSDIDGNVVEVRVDQILAEQIDSTIYNSDGTFTEDRTLTGDGSTDVSFVNLDTFGVGATYTNISDTLILPAYGDTSVTGTLSTILAVDADGNVIEIVADDILDQQVDSTIYTHDGSLTDERFMDMNTHNLHFVSDDNADTTVITDRGWIAIGRSAPTPAAMAGRNIKLDVNGDILAMQVHSSSDRRFKKNIVTVSDALSKVMNLRGVNYDFRLEEFADMDFPKENQLGFIAQEIEEVIPEVVKTDGRGYKSVDYSKVTALLTEAIKEQQQVINSLEAQLSTAQADNTKMASEIADIKDMIKTLMSNTASTQSADE